MRRMTVLALAVCLAAAGLWRPVLAVPAFPGAEGFGAETRHARGKPVFHVTRLDDEDKGQRTKYLQPGQFRYALAQAEEAGGGYIVFDVSGTIVLKRAAFIPSNTYVAGQSAPGKGIAIEGNAILIGRTGQPSHDVVIRHLRFRGHGPRGSDAFNIEGEGTENIVLDHISVSFFRDGAVDIVSGAKNVTLQWSHCGDAYGSGTREEYHCEPHLLRTNVDRVSMHHNYFTHAHSRVPAVQDTVVRDGFLMEFSNNVVYNFRKYPSSFDAHNGKANVIGNYYVPGRFTHGDADGQYRGAVIGSNGFTVHVRDNRFISGIGHDDSGRPEGTDQDVVRGKDAPVTGSRPDDTYPETAIMGKIGAIGPTPGVFNYSPTRFDEIPKITYIPVEQNINEVMAKFGAFPRDNTDRRLVRELLTRTGDWKLEIPNDGNEYGGTSRADADNDGMADDWEAKHGKDLEPNGHELDTTYDNIEVYLNELADALLRDAEPVNAHQALTGAAAER